MSVLLELSDKEFKTTIINMLITLMDEVDSIQEQMGSVSREVEILKNQKEMLEIKNSDVVTFKIYIFPPLGLELI